MGTPHGRPPPIPAWLNDLQDVAFSPLSSVFLLMLKWDLLHPKVLLPAGDFPVWGRGSQRTTAPFSQQENTSGSIPSPQQGCLCRCCAPAAPPCSTPLPGLIRHFGKSLLPVFSPCSLWSSQEHQAPSSPLSQVLVSVSSSWDVFQDMKTPAMNGFAGIPLKMRNVPSIQQVPAQDKPRGC